MDLLDEIAFYLPGWRIDRRVGYPKLLGPGRAKIVIHEEKARLRFSGQLPDRHDRYGYSWNYYGFTAEQSRGTRASCAKSRGVVAIVDDIERRLIKNYLPMFEVAKQKIAEEKAALEELSQVEQLTKRVLKARRYGHRQEFEPRRELCFKGGTVDIGQFKGGYMRFRIGDLSYEEGLKLAAFLSNNITFKD